MAKLGDMPINLVLTRDQIRLIRGMLATTAIRGELIPAFQDVKDVLDNAETAGTIAYASRAMTVQERIATIPHWRCGTIHPGIRCPK